MGADERPVLVDPDAGPHSALSQPLALPVSAAATGGPVVVGVDAVLTSLQGPDREAIWYASLGRASCIGTWVAALAMTASEADNRPSGPPT